MSNKLFHEEYVLCTRSVYNVYNKVSYNKKIYEIQFQRINLILISL